MFTVRLPARIDRRRRRTRWMMLILTLVGVAMFIYVYRNRTQVVRIDASPTSPQVVSEDRHPLSDESIVERKRQSENEHLSQKMELDNPKALLQSFVEVLHTYHRECSGKSFHKPLPAETVNAYESIRQRMLASDDVKTLVAQNHLRESRFCDIEFGCFSQNGEDGILLFLFGLIGWTNKRGVELCGGLGYENNHINFGVNHGFELLMVDGNPNNAKLAREFFDKTRMQHRPVFLNEFIYAETIVEKIHGHGFGGDLDLLSIDMDGMDYWVLKALLQAKFNPRVIIVEIQEVWGHNIAVTRPYKPDFQAKSIPEMGASIKAFEILLETFGYRLIGCIKDGFNAFFLRNDVGAEIFPTNKPYPREACFNKVRDMTGWKNELLKRLSVAKRLDWMLVRKDDVEQKVVEINADVASLESDWNSYDARPRCTLSQY